MSGSEYLPVIIAVLAIFITNQCQLPGHRHREAQSLDDSPVTCKSCFFRCTSAMKNSYFLWKLCIFHAYSWKTITTNVRENWLFPMKIDWNLSILWKIVTSSAWHSLSVIPSLLRFPTEKSLHPEIASFHSRWRTPAGRLGGESRRRRSRLLLSPLAHLPAASSRGRRTKQSISITTNSPTLNWKPTNKTF